jgi:hypothetical protein
MNGGGSAAMGLSPFLNSEAGAGNSAFMSNLSQLPQVNRLLGGGDDLSVKATRVQGEFTVTGDISSLPKNLQQQARQFAGDDPQGPVTVTIQLSGDGLKVAGAQNAVPDVMFVRAPVDPKPPETRIKNLSLIYSGIDNSNLIKKLIGCRNIVFFSCNCTMWNRSGDQT